MEQDISFNCGGFEMLRLCSNGDIYVKGVLAVNDCQVVEGFQLWLKASTKMFGSSCIINHQTMARHEWKGKRDGGI